MRPCDVLRLHSSNITNGRLITYIPEKKKNYRDNYARMVTVPLTKTLKQLEQVANPKTKATGRC